MFYMLVEGEKLENILRYERTIRDVKRWCSGVWESYGRLMFGLKNVEAKGDAVDVLKGRGVFSWIRKQLDRGLWYVKELRDLREKIDDAVVYDGVGSYLGDVGYWCFCLLRYYVVGYWEQSDVWSLNARLSVFRDGYGELMKGADVEVDRDGFIMYSSVSDGVMRMLDRV